MRPMRRTQAERTATTRGALLDATIECLIETGYAGVTTTSIASRAGVTRGAQAHHFGTKAELVTEAVRHLATKLAAEFESTRPGRVLEDMLDRIWEVHTSPFFGAVMELWVAARTDPELRRHFARLESDVTAALREAGIRLMPSFAEKPQTARLLDTSLAVIRGVALLGFVHDAATAERHWQVARRHLLELWSDAV